MRDLLWTAGAILCIACSPAYSVKPLPLEQRTAEIARSMNTIAPKEFGNGITLLSVTAEGRTLVLTLKGLVDWRRNFSDEEIAKVLGASLCESESIQAAIEEGAAFRVDPLTKDAKPLPHLYVCGSKAT